MPNVFVHTLFAERTLDHWRTTGDAPFDVAAPLCRDAFVHGALGPDLGYFPGGDTLLSELTHRLRSGRMARALIARAQTDVERAFAWGWVTHVLVDVQFHPVVERIAARVARSESTGASGLGSRTAIDLAHVRVEVGLDGVILGRHPHVGARLGPVFEGQGLAFLADAFTDVYGPVTTAAALLAGHQSMVRWHRCMPPLLRWMTADWSASSPRTARAIAPLLRAREGGWTRYVGAGPVAAAFVSPVRPGDDLVGMVAVEAERFPAVLDAVRSAADWLPDLDLEDGCPVLESEPKPGAAQTLRALETRIFGETGPRAAA